MTDIERLNDIADKLRCWGYLSHYPDTQHGLIHCAANFRVTAFYALYAMKHPGWSEAQAEEFRASIRQASTYPEWERFIEQMKAKIG